MLRDRGDVDQIGRRLGVAFIADGSVQGSASRLRLTVRRLRADDAVAIWANTFDFMAEDLSLVARSVAGRCPPRGDARRIADRAN